MTDFKCIILTTEVRGIPHLASLVASNPELDVEVYTVKQTGYQGWFNCDRNILNWWKENQLTETAGRFLFLEYDVLVERDLTEHFPIGEQHDAEVMDIIERDRMCIAEGVKLKKYGIAACRISPLSVVMLSRDVLNDICNPAMDAVFNDMIYCEVRLPSVIRHLGHRLTVNDKLTPERGIHHPVK